MSLIEKIDAEITKYERNLAEAKLIKSQGGIMVFTEKLEEAKKWRGEFLSSQKEPCEYCSEVDFVNVGGSTFYKSLVRSNISEEDLYLVKDEYGTYELVACGTAVLTKAINFCPICGRQLNQPIES